MSRRRWLPLLVGTCTLGLGSLGLAACGVGTSEPTATDTAVAPPPSTSTTPPPSTTPVPTGEPESSEPEAASCRATVDAMTPQEQAGQVFMVAVTNGGSPDASTLAVIDEYQIGSVLLLGESLAGADHVSGFIDSIHQSVGDDVLIAVDQEGGLVQRLQGPGFETIPDAVTQATMPDLTDAAERWGTELADVGVDVNLAPVADVVPADRVDSNAPVGQLRRGYGSDPAAVSESVTAFVQGMQRSGVGTSVKHYPGLGRVAGNPDFADAVVDDETTRDDPALAPFGAAIEAGAPMVMISSATYTRIDAEHQGVFSTVILQEMLRGDLGFDGVVISDDLGVAANLDGVPVAERGWRFVRAGGDLVINADPNKAATMVEGLLAEMDREPQLADQVAASATRVMDLKHDLGKVDCR